MKFKNVKVYLKLTDSCYLLLCASEFFSDLKTLFWLKKKFILFWLSMHEKDCVGNEVKKFMIVKEMFIDILNDACVFTF